MKERYIELIDSGFMVKNYKNSGEIAEETLTNMRKAGVPESKIQAILDDFYNKARNEAEAKLDGLKKSYAERCNEIIAKQGYKETRDGALLFPRLAKQFEKSFDEITGYAWTDSQIIEKIKDFEENILQSAFEQDLEDLETQEKRERIEEEIFTGEFAIKHEEITDEEYQTLREIGIDETVLDDLKFQMEVKQTDPEAFAKMVGITLEKLRKREQKELSDTAVSDSPSVKIQTDKTL